MTGYAAHVVITEAGIGGKAIYLLLVWLISGAGGSWMSERKGYGERVGLTLGLLLSAVGLLIVFLLPGRAPGPGGESRGGCRAGVARFEPVGGLTTCRPSASPTTPFPAAPLITVLARPGRRWKDRGQGKP